MIACRVCREHLPGYIARELPPAVRSQVAEHIQTCDACYAAYVHQRELSSELSSTLPGLGNPVPSLDRIWAGVEAEMRAPKRPTISFEQARYSVAVVLLVIVLLLPWSLRAHQFNLPTPPTPDTVNTPATPAVLTAKTTSEFLPPVQPNHAPVLGATDTP